MDLDELSYQSIDKVVTHVERLRDQKSRLVIAIDGRGGAGKSSLARALVARLARSAHIEHDWFHLPKAQVVDAHRFDHARLISEVIVPFRSGTSKLSFRRYNWGYLADKPDGFHDDLTTIEDKEILIIEGCETLHKSLVCHLDLSIWVDTPPQVALERGIRRDIDEYKLDPDSVNAAWREWSVWESESLARDDRRARADLMIR
jgi:uridine kinase